MDGEFGIGGSGIPGSAGSAEANRLAAADGEDTASAPGGYSRDDQLVRDLAGRLSFLWDKYISFVHLMLTLSTGSILLTTNLIELDGAYANIWALFWGWAAMLLCVFISMAWRALSQQFMEQEVFGPKFYVENAYYDKLPKGRRFTSSFLEGKTKRYGFWHAVCKGAIFGSCGSFIVGLALLGVFVVTNLHAR